MAESKTEKMRKLFADKQVSTEQLEDVAGGCTAQIAQDSRYLNVLLRGHPDQCDRYGETRAMYETESIGAEVTKAWAAVGITYQINSRGLKEPLNKSLRASAGSFSACRCQIPLDVAMLRLRGLFLDSRKNPSTDARIDLISVSLTVI